MLREIETGVLDGAVLSPILYNLYINKASNPRYIPGPICE